MRQTLQVAVIQPKSYLRAWEHIFPVPFDDSTPPESQQLDEASRYVERAAAGGAELIVFPEMYPGPLNDDGAFTLDDTLQRMTTQARQHQVWVVFSGALADGKGNYANAVHVAAPDGQIAGVYHKMIPACGEPWTPGSTPLVVNCDGVQVGIATCWEAWFPEIPRMLAMRGADVILFPTGALLYELTDRWMTILAARAAENTVYTAASVNLFGLENGMNVVFAPEQMLASATGESILSATLDIERLRYLRRTDERLTVPKLYRSIPGLMRALPADVVQTYTDIAGAWVERANTED
jgi:predicted amidohydrolase